MKKILTFAAMAAFALCAATFTSCDESGGTEEPGDGQITLPAPGDKEQTAYADGGSTKGFTFTAKSDWTATVKEGATRASGVSWVRLLLGGAETYSGAAGTFNLSIEIDLNPTGKERKATITVVSGTDRISVTVTQSGVKEDNKPLTGKDLLIAGPWKHIYMSDKTLTGKYAGEFDEYKDIDATMTFKADSTITAVGPDQDIFTDYFGFNSKYSISGDKFTMHVKSENAIVASAEFDITKLTGTEFEFAKTFTREWEDKNEDGTVDSGTGECTLTFKFARP